MNSSSRLIRTIRYFMDIAMHYSMRERFHFAKTTGLSMPQFGILMQLHYRSNCGVSDISDHFDITNAAASQLVDKLVHMSYLERTEDPSDRRAKLLNLTDQGRSFVEQGLRERHRWMDELVRNLSAEEKVKVSEALAILTEAAQRNEEKENFPKASRVST